MKARHITTTVLGAIIGSIVMLGLGCATNWEAPPQDQHGTVQRDPLSYGAITATVKKGETTQEDIVRLFGPPNITTINASGEEVWVYDRISNSSQQNGWTEARRFDAFFGLGSVGAVSVKEGDTHDSSSRTLKVIINFDQAKKVKDYSARATQF
jgi:hypothetical protein